MMAGTMKETFFVLFIFTPIYILATTNSETDPMHRKIDGTKITSVQELQSELQDLRSSSAGQHLNLRLLEIENIALDEGLPLGLFKNSSIRQLILRSITLKELSSPDKRESFFDGLQESLESLAFINIAGETEKSRVNILSGFTKLKTIIMTRSSTNLFTFTGNFLGMSDVPLVRIMITATNIEKVPDGSFKHFGGTLAELVIEGCELEKGTRNWFEKSTTMKVLRRINLSSNKLSSLNRDFFAGMPNLAEVDLHDNRLIAITDKKYAPVFNGLNLKYLGLYDTAKINCDKNTDWHWLIKDNAGGKPPFYERPFRELQCDNGTAVKSLKMSSPQPAPSNPLYSYITPYGCNYLQE